MTSLLYTPVVAGRYVLELARELEDVRAAQRLRFEVFNLELHEGLPEAFVTGLDADPFDEVCDHLLVREASSRSVVGTYRLQSGPSAARHRGYYSEREFVFATFEKARPQIIELGRACVAAEHRHPVVLSLLWKGIAAYAQNHHARYLVGCSSLTSQDEGAGLAVHDELACAHLAPRDWRTEPQPGWHCRRSPVESAPVKVPRLLRAYLAIGARICGEPAIDREFSTIDFLTWLDLESMPARVIRKFLG